MNTIIKKPGFGELVEKKSKFLSEAYHIETVEEAEEYIAQTKHTHTMQQSTGCMHIFWTMVQR